MEMSFSQNKIGFDQFLYYILKKSDQMLLFRTTIT